MRNYNGVTTIRNNSRGRIRCVTHHLYFFCFLFRNYPFFCLQLDSNIFIIGDKWGNPLEGGFKNAFGIAYHMLANVLVTNFYFGSSTLLPAYRRMVAKMFTRGFFLGEGLLCLYASIALPLTNIVSSLPNAYSSSILTRSSFPTA